MSLNITSPIKTQQGIELPTAYGRVAVVNQIDGTYIEGAVTLFASEEAFLGGAKPIYVNDLKVGVRVDYNYETEGHDILDIAHDALITLLAKQGVTSTKNL